MHSFYLVKVPLRSLSQ